MGFEGKKMLKPVCGQEYCITAEWEGRNCRKPISGQSMGVWEAGVRRLRLAGHSAEVIRLVES